jgi:CheY-like chemotaxis protein/HPt (histidine-containing phosphotransfer) domain-containing protein
MLRRLWAAQLNVWPITASLMTLAVSLLLTVLISHHQAATAEKNALAIFAAEQNAHFDSARAKIETTFSLTYGTLRTMGLMPAVISIDRHASGFEGDTRATVQQLYNNIATAVPVSEIHIVPADLDPDAIDPLTGNRETPIATFDYLILGLTAEKAIRDGDPIADSEIDAYREMRRQCDYFRTNYPSLSAIQNLDYPAMSSAPVIARDNTESSRTNPAIGDGASRMAIIYSVPFYGPDQQFKGMVSAVFRIDALRRMLAGTHCAASLQQHEILFSAPETTLDSRRQFANLAAGEIPTDAAYTRTTRANIIDAYPWRFLFIVPGADYKTNPLVLATRENRRVMFLGGFVFSAMLTLMILSLSSGRRRAMELLEQRAASLQASESQLNLADRAPTTLFPALESFAKNTHEKKWRGRILVAEDNAINQMVVQQMLALLGFACDIVNTGGRAVEAAFGARHYDVVLMDCQMPEMDGFEATREIRRREKNGDGNGRHIPIVALTVNAIAGDRERCLAAGMDGYMTKPFDRERLMKAIEPHLASAAAKPVEPPDEQAAPNVAQDEPAPTDSETSVTIIDVPQLLHRCMGKSAFAEKILGVFAQNSSQYISDIEQAVVARDAKALALAAHSLKGVAATLAASGLHDSAHKLELLAKKNETENLESEMANLREQVRQTQAFIDRGISMEDSSKP